VVLIRRSTLSLRHTIGFDAMFGALPDVPHQNPQAEQMSAAQSPIYDGKGYGVWLHADWPFDNTFTTNGRRAIHGMLRQRLATELVYR